MALMEQTGGVGGGEKRSRAGGGISTANWRDKQDSRRVKLDWGTVEGERVGVIIFQ